MTVAVSVARVVAVWSRVVGEVIADIYVVAVVARVMSMVGMLVTAAVSVTSTTWGEKAPISELCRWSYVVVK